MFKQQQSSSEATARTTVELHDKKQLMTNKIQEDQRDVQINVCNNSMHMHLLNFMKFQETVHGLSEDKQLSKAATVMVKEQ